MDQGKRYRIREDRGEQTTTLLNSLSLDQLRSVLAIVVTGTVPRCRTKEDAVEALLESAELGAVRRAAYRIEAITPSKHCFFVRMERAPDDHLIEKLLAVDARNSDAAPHLTIAQEIGEQVFLTFEFTIILDEWVTSADGNSKHRKQKRVRQPLIVRFARWSPVAIITYPGFSRGQLGRDSVTSEQLVKQVYIHLQTQYPIKVVGFPIVKHINDLAQAHSNAVVVVAQSALSEHGRMDVEAGDRKRSIVDVLMHIVSRSFQDKIPPTELRNALGEATKSVAVESMLVCWRSDNLICRLLFWDIGPEFLFVWPQENRSFGVLDKIVELLLSVAQDAEIPNRNQLWERVLAMRDGDLLLPAEIIQQANVSTEDLRAIIADALRGGLVRPEYRLRVQTHPESNPLSGWTTDLASLATTFLGPNEEVIDGKDPSNILIAFRRVYRDGAFS